MEDCGRISLWKVLNITIYWNKSWHLPNPMDSWIPMTANRKLKHYAAKFNCILLLTNDVLVILKCVEIYWRFLRTNVLVVTFAQLSETWVKTFKWLHRNLSLWNVPFVMIWGIRDWLIISSNKKRTCQIDIVCILLWTEKKGIWEIFHVISRIDYLEK